MNSKPLFLAILTTIALFASFVTPDAKAQAAQCSLTRKIMFGGLDWESNSFHTEVARFILEKGYGCKTDVLPGATIPILGGVVRGDIDIVMEVLQNSAPEVWNKGRAAGTVQEVGINYPDSTQHWYVPRYLVEGDEAPAKDLKNVSDLAKYKDLFRDPEEPAKGRFYNCISGWECETVNSKKLHAYKLDASFVNFRPGTGAALDAAITSAIKRKKPIVFYYWGPTWLLGKFNNNLVALNEPVFDEVKWKALKEAKSEADVKEATAYAVLPVLIGANSAFAKEAPEIIEFLHNYKTTAALVSQALADMQDNKASAADAAQHFLKAHPELWQKWVKNDISARVTAALK